MAKSPRPWVQGAMTDPLPWNMAAIILITACWGLLEWIVVAWLRRLDDDRLAASLGPWARRWLR